MKVGDRLEILYMQGEPHYAGRSGTITSIEKDPYGDTAIHGTWGGLAVYVGVDNYKIYPKEEN